MENLCIQCINTCKKSTNVSTCPNYEISLKNKNGFDYDKWLVEIQGKYSYATEYLDALNTACSAHYEEQINKITNDYADENIFEYTQYCQSIRYELDKENQKLKDLLKNCLKDMKFWGYGYELHKRIEEATK